MQFVLLATSVAVACAIVSAEVQSPLGYHESIGIPLATRIKEAEENYFANQSFMSRIVGGVFSKPNDHPYLAGVVITFVNHAGTGVCGSALVSRTRLVSAAHCWFDGRLQAGRFVVVLGSRHLFSGGERIATSTVTTHPNWSPNTLLNDVAVVYLTNPVQLSSNIQPIALASDQNESFEGDWAIAAGFGKTSDKDTGTPALAEVSQVNLKVIGVRECQAVFGEFVQDSNVCTDGAGGVGICGGDTGGPLVANKESAPVLIGIGSFVAAAGCERGFPSVFSRITSFKEFITVHL